MKNAGIVFTAPNQVEFQQLDADISLGAHDALVQTRYSLISAGTELACLRGGESWFNFPATPGYAAVGEIVETGASVSDFAPGDMVYCWGGHQQYSIIDTANPRAMFMRPHADLSLHLVPFTRMATVAMTALRISTIELGDWVAVTGLGSVGNLAAQLAGLQGGRVIGLDLSAARVELARQCGLAHALVMDDTVAQQIDAITGGQGVTTLIEATGVPAALESALPLIGRYGEAILLGTPRGAHQTDLTGVLGHVHLDGKGNVTFKGAHEWRYPVKPDNFVKHNMVRNSAIAMDAMVAGKLHVAPLHTHTLSPDDAASAYRGLQTDKDTTIGVVFDWG